MEEFEEDERGRREGGYNRGNNFIVTRVNDIFLNLFRIIPARSFPPVLRR